MILPKKTETTIKRISPKFFTIRRKPNGAKVIVLSKKHHGEKIEKEFTLNDFAEALSKA